MVASAPQKPAILIAHFRSDIVSGAERSIADLMDHLQAEFDVSMLVPKEGALAAFYRKRGFLIWVREVQNFRRRYPGLHWFQSWLFARAMRQRGIQAVLCNTFSAASRVSSACRMAGIPYAIYIREFISDRPLNRKLLAGAANIFVISRDLEAYISAMIDPQRIRLTYNHINPQPILDRLAAHRASGQRLLPFEPHQPVVGLVGRITPFKQQDLFIRAIPRVLAEIPEARFAVVGSAQGKDIPYEASVKQLADALGVSQKVAFLGHRTDNIELTSEFAVACLTSTREPLGRVVLEANLIGCPVIASNAGGSAELVEDGKTGLKFNATGPDACSELADRIIRLLRDPELRSRLATQARENIFETFAGERFVRVQAAYIRELSQSPNGHSS